MARVRFQVGKQKRGGRVVAVLFGLVFAGMGGAFLFFIFVRPVLGMIAARSWVATPCVIESSEVERHAGDDGSTYSIEVAYTYQFEGRTYRSERYQFADINTSGRKGKERVVRALPAGSTATCYVNPDDPSQAVIHRGWSHALWFALIPLVFLVIGLAVIGFALFGRSGGAGVLSASARDVDWLPNVKHEVEGGRVVLRAQASPLGKLFFLILFAAFWNGIVSVFVTMAVKSHLKGDPEWFLTFFIVPFVLVGLLVAGLVVWQFLALFNPKFELTLDALEARPGDVLHLSWRIDGAVGRLRRVVIELVGEETARYRRGTDTVTDTYKFCERTLHETPDDAGLVSATGSCAVVIPADAMHSFKSPNNGIAWRLRVRGDVPKWPDVSNEYEVLVVPGTAGKPAR